MNKELKKSKRLGHDIIYLPLHETEEDSNTKAFNDSSPKPSTSKKVITKRKITFKTKKMLLHEILNYQHQKTNLHQRYLI